MPERIQLRRNRGWRLPADAVNVARPTMFGNPWKIIQPGGWIVDGPGMFFNPETLIDDAHRLAVHLHRNWLTLGDQAPALKVREVDESVEDRQHLATRRASVLGQLHILAGRDLACWCPAGLECHADTLIDLANSPETCWNSVD